MKLTPKVSLYRVFRDVGAVGGNCKCVVPCSQFCLNLDVVCFISKLSGNGYSPNVYLSCD